ncbi:MAG: elongation factor P [Pelagibacteraceae bacterium]|nr:elongation factor P [Pelagibacteraceae bacterium]|tara:strand:+ start:163 stop:729 length:567 start_codon:yes stop_codon:yes gene_type:complete
MKIGANELKVGNIIQHNNALWKVAKLAHTQPGKGGAYIQAELKNISNQSKLNERFRSSESIERVRSEQIEHQFLFRSGDDFTFMNSVNYEQTILNKSIIEDDTANILEDGMNVIIEFFDEKPMNVNLPEQIILKIIETEAVVKGQTASSSYKPALLEKNIKTTVPPHIEVGDKIKLNSKDFTYIEKSK